MGRPIWEVHIDDVKIKQAQKLNRLGKWETEIQSCIRIVTNTLKNLNNVLKNMKISLDTKEERALNYVTSVLLYIS